MTVDELTNKIAILNCIDKKEAASYAIWFIKSYPDCSTNDMLEIMHDAIVKSPITIERLYLFCRALIMHHADFAFKTHVDAAKRLSNVGIVPKEEMRDILYKIKNHTK